MGFDLWSSRHFSTRNNSHRHQLLEFHGQQFYYYLTIASPAIVSLEVFARPLSNRLCSFAQVNMTAIDIFTGKKLEDMSPSTHNMSVPVVKRKDFQLLDVDAEGFLSLMNEDGTTKDDLKLPEGEIGDEIKV
jgi:hypothetical protein